MSPVTSLSNNYSLESLKLVVTAGSQKSIDELTAIKIYKFFKFLGYSFVKVFYSICMINFSIFLSKTLLT